MKKSALVLLTALLLSACTNDSIPLGNVTTSETVSLTSSTTDTAPEEITVIETENVPAADQHVSDKYSEAEDKISYYMGRFISLGTGNYDDIQSRIITEEKDAMGNSAEGGEFTIYKTDEGEILRYSAVFYGETGRSENNYYIIDESCAYFTVLNMSYYCLDWRQEQFGDILKYSFEEYWIDGEEYYLIDRSDLVLIPYEKNPAEFLEKYLSE